MPSITPSARCSAFFNLRTPSSTNHRPRRSSTGQGQPSCAGRLDRVVQWVGNGVATAFFASLERCSCIKVSTDEDHDEARDLPLIHDDGNARDIGEVFDGGEGIRRRVRGKGKRDELDESSIVLSREARGEIYRAALNFRFSSSMLLFLLMN
ncbi:uncharacterized protein A4U43_C03F7870 [Asparagus officinalis]|uniref:Uncharacterized protein n=1 Tax=Asparagus officinalis TaxID=4686 RepID=A0A5P1F8S5_ASPOF|nr:uncharacterized protein A4U43_C03F7870 [Asparagus officinalis]